MQAARSTSSTAKHVGDKVRVAFSGSLVPAKIVEDRGPLGVEGRHIYVVEADVEGEVVRFDVAPEDLR